MMLGNIVQVLLQITVCAALVVIIGAILVIAAFGIREIKKAWKEWDEEDG